MFSVVFLRELWAEDKVDVVADEAAIRELHRPGELLLLGAFWAAPNRR